MNRKTQQNFDKTLKLIVLTLGLGLVLLPIWYMIITSFKPQTMIFELPPRLWPQTWTLKNYIEALGKDHFGLYFLNSAKVAIISTLLTVLVSSMLAFAFARLHLLYFIFSCLE
jgi:multiple sugar transport system permease protein